MRAPRSRGASSAFTCSSVVSGMWPMKLPVVCEWPGVLLKQSLTRGSMQVYNLQVIVAGSVIDEVQRRYSVLLDAHKAVRFRASCLGCVWTPVGFVSGHASLFFCRTGSMAMKLIHRTTTDCFPHCSSLSDQFAASKGGVEAKAAQVSAKALVCRFFQVGRGGAETNRAAKVPLQTALVYGHN